MAFLWSFAIIFGNSDKAWKETGFTDGQKDAQELSYDDFQMLENKGAISEETREWVIENHFKYYENLNEEYYFEGWIEGALNLWNEIKDEV